MQKYSDFFKTLHDEQGPTGYLGRGTHYSVLRAVVFHDPIGEPLPQGQFVDFAVIWDEDHDTRVMEPIEEIYRRGLLSSCIMFGERQGFFTAILSIMVQSPLRVAFLRTEIDAICQSLKDPWPSDVVHRNRTTRAKNPIISDNDKKVDLYLRNLQMLWELGVQGWPPFNRAFLEMVEDLTLSIRSANCLKNDNILYVGDLVQKSQTEILQIPNMGRVGLNEIRLALAGLGLDLGMEIPGWPPNNIESLAEGLTKHLEEA
jgi:hypothetical protein